MVYVGKTGATLKQMAYARGILSGRYKNKKEVALSVGYTPNIARSITQHIESKQGFHNAMSALARESNDLALAAMVEFKARGFSDFSNKDLVGALNAIGQAWERFNPKETKKHLDGKENRLRTLVLQRIENQTVVEGQHEEYRERVEASEKELAPEVIKEEGEEDDEYLF